MRVRRGKVGGCTHPIAVLFGKLSILLKVFILQVVTCTKNHFRTEITMHRTAF